MRSCDRGSWCDGTVALISSSQLVSVCTLIERSQLSSMSWQEYVDEHLMCELDNGTRLQSAAILGHDGGVWAESPDFPQISEPEVRAACSYKIWARVCLLMYFWRATLVSTCAMTPCPLTNRLHTLTC